LTEFCVQVKNFEPIWGKKSLPSSSTKSETSTSSSLSPPKPSSYNLRRSPLVSPSSESGEASPLDVDQTEYKDKLKSGSTSRNKFELQEDMSEDEEDDDNDEDFELIDESSSEVEDVEEMSSARTTGLVQRSPNSMSVNTVSRNRKRSGVEDDTDNDLVLKKSKPVVLVPVPLHLSPIQEGLFSKILFYIICTKLFIFFCSSKQARRRLY
jgi:hypothetical protein